MRCFFIRVGIANNNTNKEEKIIMELEKVIKERRSIRKFKVDPVPHDILEELLQTAMWAPSGRNTQPWKFVILTGKKKEEFLKLSNQAISAIDAKKNNHRLHLK